MRYENCYDIIIHNLISLHPYNKTQFNLGSKIFTKVKPYQNVFQLKGL